MSEINSDLNVNIDINAGGALAAIKALQSRISDFHTSLAKGSATANLKSLQMQQSLIDTLNATGQFSAQMKTVASSTQTFTTALEKNKLSMGQYFKYAGGASKSFGRFFKTEMDTIQKVAIERVKDLQTQYIKMGRDANGALKTIAVRPLALDMKNLATQTQIAAQKQQLLNQLLKQGSTNLLNFGKNTQWAGRQLMVGFTIPLGILGTTAARTFMDMEKQAIAFKRVYGDTFTASKETDAMLKQVQQLASEFTKYGVAVEKTMEQAAKAAATGKMGADLLAQVSEATRLSVLGNVEQAQALETTISLTNAFGTAADELRGKINFLNAVENQTVTSIEDLTIAIPKAAPVIKQLGGNVEDLTFFLTAMREGGINASESANALKSGLASLINPTKKASDFLQSFGININKIVEGNKGDVQGLVVDFAKALDTLDPLNRARAIEQLFGKFQFSRLSTLFQNVIKDGSQAARVLELTRQSSAELGILAQRELNRIASSPMYKFEKAVADFKKELAPVGEEFLKAVTPIINFATDVLKAFNNLDGGVKQFIVNSTGLIAGIGPVFLMTFGLLANGVANIIKGFTFVKNVFNKASSASTILGETTDYMTQQQLEAATVAASLEQVHNKLTQAFTSEAQAVANLTAAYQKAVGAQVAFTGPAPAGKRAAKPKKYADGVFSVPGPKGAGDVVPAMLSPGEAVIPAKMASKYSRFISGMISGNIPGFRRGTAGLDRAHIQDALDVNDPAVRAQIEQQFPGYFGLSKEMQGRVFFTGSLIAEVSNALNQKIKKGGGGATADEFSQYWNERSGKLLSSAKIGGADISDPATAKALQEIEDEIGRQVEKEARKSGKKITDQDISRVTQRVISEKSRDSAPRSAAKTALRTSSGVLGNLRTDFKNQELQDLERKGVVRREGSKVIDNATGLQVGRVKSNGVTLGQKPIDASGGYARKPFLSRKIEEQTQSAQQENNRAKNKNTEAVNADTKETKKGTTAKRNARKKAEKKPVPTAETQAKVAATPKVVVTEQLGNGVTREVDGNGKEKFRINGKYANPQKAMELASASGAATKPGGRIRGILTGLPGKLGLGALATMGVGAATGNEQISGISDQLFQAAMLSSFIPPGTMKKMKDSLGGAKDKFMKSSIGQKYAGTRMYGKFGEATKGLSDFKVGAKAEVASKGLMKALPFLAKGATMVGLRFLNMIPIVGQVALALEVVYTVATANARAQEEISKSIVETLTMTKEKLDGLNEFFGSDAKLSGIRTLSVIGEGQSGEQATLAEQFRQSEQFKNTYKETAGKLKDASPQQFALTMQSLGVDLYGQGMSEEQVQIIIDAIKKEAGQQSVVIKFKDLRLDTETGRENLANSLKTISDGAVKEFQSNRDFLGLNFEAQAKLDEYESQMSGFISGLSQEFERGRISSSEFEASFGDIEAAFNKAEAANPGDGLQLLNSVLMNVSPEVAQASAAISDMSTKMLVLKLAAEGAAMSTQLLADAAAGNQKAIKHLESLDKLEKDKNKRIRQQEKVIQGISQQQQNLQKEERNLNDVYDERIKALERINQLQEQTAKQKQNQLDLADALSRGDVFAAAQAVQKIRADQAALALEQQKNILIDEKDKKAKAIQSKADSLDGALSSARSKIADINAEQGKEYKSEINAATIEQMYKGVPGKLWNILNWQTYFADEQTKYKEFSKYIAGDPGARGNIAGTLGFMGNLGPLNPVGTLLKGGLGIYKAVKGNKETTKAAGGYISGPGSGTSDSIPARLSNGEYVIRAKAVNALGTDVLDKMNHAEKFADGGYVDTNSLQGIANASKKKIVKYGTPTKSNTLSVMADIKRLQEIEAQAKDSNPFNDASSEYRSQLVKNIATYKTLYGNPASSTLSVSQLKSKAASASSLQQLSALNKDTSGVMEAARFASYLTPVLGTGVAISETANSASRGDVLGTALNALGTIPGIGGAAKVIEKLGGKIGPSKFGNALTKTGSSGFNAYQAMNNFIPNAVSKLGRKIITNPITQKLLNSTAAAKIENFASMFNPATRINLGQREAQAKVAAKTEKSFSDAAKKLEEYYTTGGYQAGFSQERIDALRAYGQILARNERYAFANPGTLQRTAGLYKIDDMEASQLHSLAAGIISSNFGKTLPMDGSISPYAVLTSNRNYRVQAPGRIQDFLYTRGIIGKPAGFEKTFGFIKQSGKYAFPATGPMAHIFGGGNSRGSFGAGFVQGTSNRDAIIRGESMFGVGAAITELVRNTIAKRLGRGESSFSSKMGPLATLMGQGTMKKSDYSVFNHEYQHVEDKFRATSGNYRGFVGVSPQSFVDSRGGYYAPNAVLEATARAKDALVSNDLIRPYTPMAGGVTPGMSEEDTLAEVMKYLASKPGLLSEYLYGGRTHQFNGKWFERYVSEILEQRQLLKSNFPDKNLQIHTDEELEKLLLVGKAFKKYNVDPYLSKQLNVPGEEIPGFGPIEDFWQKRLRDFQDKYGVNSPELRQEMQIWQANKAEARQASKAASENTLLDKIRIAILKKINPNYAKQEFGQIAPVMPSAPEGPRSAQDIINAFVKTALVTDNYMMDLIGPSDFKKAFKEVFSNRGSAQMNLSGATLGMTNMFGYAGLGGTLPAGNFTSKQAMRMVAEELPKKMAITEASIAAINHLKNGTGPESIPLALAMSPQWRSWQKVGVTNQDFMRKVFEYGQLNRNEAVLGTLSMELAQMRNTASIIPDVAFKDGSKKADKFMDDIDSVMTPFDPERYLRGDSSVQILAPRAVLQPEKIDPKNPVFKELMAQPQDAVSEFFRTIYSGMDISKTGFRIAKESMMATKIAADNPRIGFGGSIQKLDATAPFSGLVGDFSRVMYDDKIFHDLFMIKSDFRGKGISSALSPMTEELYRLLGMNRIEMVAGLESGPITWAKAGYKFNGEPQELSSKILTILGNPNLPKEDKKILESLYNKFQDEPLSITPKDVLNMSSKTNPTLGEDVLYGSSYNAVKFLKDVPVDKGLSQVIYNLVKQASDATGINIMDFIPKFKNGGMFRTSYAKGGLAMLHDKEFVMNAGAVKDYGVNNLKAMNSGTYNSGSVYNSYGVNINVGGSNSNANDIARTVIREIKRLDSQNIRSTKV
jgi:TP901 family phage tail tape measure protein